MTIEAFFLCFNESRMIEHTLNYHSQFCDKITIIDNQSTDNSVAIVKEKFPDVIIEELDTGGEYREDVQIEVRNNWWKGSNADFVIMADMDEFVVHPDLVNQLKEMKRQNVAVPKIVGYNMFSETFPDDYNTSILDQVSEKFRDRFFDKNIIFSPKLVKDMNFGVGSHTCDPEFKEGVEVKTEHSFEFNLFHFKWLSKEYLYKRHKGYADRMSVENHENNHGMQYLIGKYHIDNTFFFVKKFLNQKQTSATA